MILINLTDTSTVNRIIMTARSMSYYAPNMTNPVRISSDDAQAILRRNIEIPGTELVLCDQGKYTLSTDDGEYTFYATLEMI